MIYLGQDAIGLATSIPIFANLADIEMGEYTPTQDTLITEVSISHSLGKMPDFYLYYTTNFVLGTYTPLYAIEGSYHPLYIQDNIQKFTFTARCNKTNSTAMNTMVGTMDKDTLALNGIDDHTFKFIGNTTSLLKANVTYRYIIGINKEVIPNA